MERLMIFIDAEYVIQKIKDFGDSRTHIRLKDIQWNNLIQWIINKRKLIRCYYYSAQLSEQENPKTYQEQKEYLKELKIKIPYFEVKLGRLVYINNIWIQKGLDIKIALDMFSKAVTNQYDVAALVSGDSDFVEVIYEIKERYGKCVELYTFDYAIHDSLKLCADKHIVINDQIAKLHRFWY
ncbi:MAG: NYN domain-containing protein [Candidatus Omnitrophica bacterium]|nr:NYN domain-containing protein [Candidatus Omnitrophota bacterium]